jgi:alpha-mannosidase
VRESVARFLPRTVREAAVAFSRFPSFQLNFDGAFRYRLLQEHHPELFAELRRWVEAGRWHPAGATWDALDVNLPSPESFVRHCLYGRSWFRRELGRDPRDLFLPDCFGFGAQVPVLAAHCGLLSFATSKLRRFDEMRSAVGVPFPLGWWEGIDGSRVFALLDPGGYGEPLADPAADPEVAAQLAHHQAAIGTRIAVRFFGIGDQGGAPPARSLATLERAAGAGAPGGLRVRARGSDELLGELAAAASAERLPVHRGELLLGLHGTGCYTSQAAMKRWNARNERLAHAAEAAAAAADWLGAARYPAERLRAAWQRFLWHQFHDDLTGTSIPAAYRVSWQDEALAASELGEILRTSIAAVSRGLDTRAEGLPLVVFNPLAVARRELVTAEVPWGGGEVAVHGPGGERLPAQVEPQSPWLARLSFLAELPALGFAVFDVRRVSSPAPFADARLRSGEEGLSSGRYRLRLDERGDLASLWDESLARDLLASPLRLELFADRSRRFPAWEIHHRDLAAGARESVGGPARVRVLAAGPAAAALEVSRTLGRSRFVTRYRLVAAPAGEWLEVELEVRWRSRRRLLKATVTAADGAADAIYDVGVGGVPRPCGTPRLYEVPAQAWAALPAARLGGGLALLTERPHGWDHPDERTLRLTLLHTPAVGRRFPHQGWQDLGSHRFRFALAGHRDDWRAADVPALAARFRHPPLAFVADRTRGPLGRSWSFLAADAGAGAVTVKRREEGEGWVVRLLDPTGRGGARRLRFAAATRAVERLDGGEQPLAEAVLTSGRREVVVDAPPHRPVTLGVTLAPPAPGLEPLASAPLALPRDRAAVTANGVRCRHGIGKRRRALPAELFPATLEIGGVPFALAASTADAHALAPAGQRLSLPAGDWDRLWMVVAAGGGARELVVRIGEVERGVEVPDAFAPLAQEDRVQRLALGGVGLWRVRPGGVREAAVVWVADHCHDVRGRDLPYRPAALFAVSLALPAGAREVHLGSTPGALLFAATATAGGVHVVSVSPPP